MQNEIRTKNIKNCKENTVHSNASMNLIKVGISHGLFFALKVGSCSFLRHYASSNLHMNLFLDLLCAKLWRHTNHELRKFLITTLGNNFTNL